MPGAAGAPGARPVGSPLAAHLLSTPPTPRQLLVQCASLHSLLQQRAAAGGSRVLGAREAKVLLPRSQAGCCPAIHSSSAVPPAPRGRPPDVCSLTGSPCSITTLARTPCVHAASLAHPRPSASPLPHSLRFLGSTISYSSRLLHMAGSGTFRAIPSYLFGQPLPNALRAITAHRRSSGSTSRRCRQLAASQGVTQSANACDWPSRPAGWARAALVRVLG